MTDRRTSEERKRDVLQSPDEGASREKLTSPSSVAGVLTIFLTALSPSLTENAVADGETRTLYLYHMHTHEQIAATYLVDGRYDQAVLQKLNWFLRDWRRDEPTNMDPRLFDVVWEAYRTAGATDPVQIVSAYRSPETNAMLRRRSRGVAKYSQHMLGKAMDTTLPGMQMSRIREIGMRMQRGGVGYYPSAGTPFVHLDVGGVRSWPRMTYDQLVRLFPDGKTVHLPTNGQPLARYEEAKAEIEARGNGAYVAPIERKARSFLAFLFGGGEEDEDAGVAAPPPSAHKQWAALAPRNSRSDRSASAADEEGGRSEAIARAESNLPRGETTLGQGPTDAEAQKAAPGKSIAVDAPLPPERPTALAKGTPLETFAAIDKTRSAASEPGDGDANSRNAADEGDVADKGESLSQAGLPLPPRRPANLLAAATDVPLPPLRPVELASLARAAPVARAAAAPASVPKETSAHAAGAIASLIDVTGTTPLRTGAGQLAPAVSASSDASASNGAQLLAYAPVQEANRHVFGEGPIGLRASLSAKPDAASPAAQRAGFVPARLDRSNFRTMTGTIPASRVAGGSVLGAAISAPRSAARARPVMLGESLETGLVSAFAPNVQAPPTDRFARSR